ncbi:hypothetical protein [uncultured Gilvimarinus sp.]|uniref:hypothetical protein n=1 Tax=uncultured Gilvimarinus sp. TaxID=1689143 RepID=UPI0030EEB7EE
MSRLKDARGPERQRGGRNLAEGDTLLLGERIVVESGARVVLDFGDGQLLTLVGPEQLLLTADLWPDVAGVTNDGVPDAEEPDTAPTTLDSSEPSNTPDIDESDLPLSQGWHYSVNLKRVGEELTPPGLDGSQVPERPAPPYTLGAGRGRRRPYTTFAAVATRATGSRTGA